MPTSSQISTAPKRPVKEVKPFNLKKEDLSLFEEDSPDIKIDSRKTGLSSDIFELISFFSAIYKN